MILPLISNLFFPALLVLSSCDRGDVKRGLPIWSSGVELTASKQPTRVFVTADLREVVLLTQPPDGQSDRLTPVMVSLNNNIVPTFRTTVSFSGTLYRYDYMVSNAATARDGIFGVSIVTPAFLPGTTAKYSAGAHDGRLWEGYVNFAVMDRPSEMGAHVPGRVILWMPSGDSDQVDSGKLNIQPGTTAGEFEIMSPLAPGFTTGKTAGLPYQPREEDLYGPGVAPQLGPLDDYFETTTLTFGPMFLPDTPFSEILANYRTGIARLSQCTGIPHTPGFLNELAEILQADQIELKLGDRLAHMTSRPATPIEAELQNCLVLIADSLVRASHKNQEKAK